MGKGLPLPSDYTEDQVARRPDVRKRKAGLVGLKRATEYNADEHDNASSLDEDEMTVRDADRIMRDPGRGFPRRKK